MDGLVFSNLLFLFLFLPLNLLCYWLASDIRGKNAVMLVFSLIFYAWGEPVYVFLLIFMTLADWFLGRIIGRNRGRPLARVAMVLSCVVSLGLLGVFKYAGFVSELTHGLFGVPPQIPVIELPIGISFYTFQLLSYVVDVYRGETKPQKKFWILLMYVSLFHQCIAGPIVRYQDVEREITSRRATAADRCEDIRRFCVGLAKKALLANVCGSLADTLVPTSGDAAVLSARPALSLWVGMLAFMLQIYLDFSAYSDMAIGMGRMIGFHYRENFDYPYLSGSVSEFWRRWHISLGSFFRDYVYIPLGGNRLGPLRTILNLFVVWFLTGLWHGASWNFVLWGMYFFVFIALERLFLSRTLDKAPGLFRHVYLLAVVFFGWVLFRFRDAGMMALVFRGMFCGNGNPLVNFESSTIALNYVFFLAAAVVASTPLLASAGRALERSAPRAAGFLQIFLPPVLLLLSTAALAGDSYNPFLYFQF